MQAHKNRKHQTGIALFMVLAAMSVLSVLVTEFSYVSQVNQRIAYDSLDQLKAHYLAKSALKLSLLRLKAYQNVKGLFSPSGGPAGASAVPKQLLDQIWSMPLIFPIPTMIPGLTMTQKDAIEKFQKDSGLEGSFSAVIESDSAKYNLNLLLPPLVKSSPQPSSSPSSAAPSTPAASPSPSPSASPSQTATQPTQTQGQFNAEVARKSLADYLWQILDQKFQSDPDFAMEYRDFKLDDLMENIIAWVDRTFESKSISGAKKEIKPKRAPFYALSELHLIHPMDDTLFQLFSPALTVSYTQGININTMTEPVLRGLVSQMTKDEITAFFKFRDSQETDNQFKTEQDFFNYLQEKVSAFRKDQNEVKKFKDELVHKNIRMITDEVNYKITVQAKVNQTSRLLEAWVTLMDNNTQKSPVAGAVEENDPGLKITFLKIL
ncbi:MAG: general secretion pathway protein GspK [Bdellovibrio sp.]|nr:general secretion pathway protein GspK [Bdellovibrio sp.]